MLYRAIHINWLLWVYAATFSPEQDTKLICLPILRGNFFFENCTVIFFSLHLSVHANSNTGFFLFSYDALFFFLHNGINPPTLFFHLKKHVFKMLITVQEFFSSSPFLEYVQYRTMNIYNNKKWVRMVCYVFSVHILCS